MSPSRKNWWGTAQITKQGNADYAPSVISQALVDLVVDMTSYDPDRRVWSGPKVAPLFDPTRSLGEVLLELLDRNPDNVIQIDADTGATLSRGQLKARAIRIAQRLSSDHGIGGGSANGGIATIIAGCSENLSALAVALQCLAMPYHALSPNFTTNEMADMMKLTQSCVVFCDAANYKTVQSAATKAISGSVKFFIMDGEVDGVSSIDELVGETGAEDDFRPAQVADSSKAVYSIFCSSGTTGLPKGVCLSHANKISTYIPSFIENPTFLTLGSIHWTSTAHVYDMAIFYEGKVVLTKQPFSGELYLDLLEQYKVEFVSGSPHLAYALSHHAHAKLTNLSHVKLWSIGGYYVSDAIRDAVDQLLPNGKSYTLYGSTEAGLVAADVVKRKRGAIGPLYPNIQMRIVDDEGNSLGIGEQGEMLIKRYVAFPGYFNNEPATKKAHDPDGWFRSGDVGYFDEDGYLHIVDRKGDIFKYITQVSPTELEEIIVRVAGVAEVCVVGIPAPDESGELPTAVVVREPGSTISEDDVVKSVEGRVMDHKRIRGGVYFVEKLPKTGKGNVKRKEVRKMIMAMK